MTPARAETTQLLARFTLPVVRRLANLSVGKKLLLIYLLDLSTVIFISSILIHEKYIAIDFSSDSPGAHSLSLSASKPARRQTSLVISMMNVEPVAS